MRRSKAQAPYSDADHIASAIFGRNGTAPLHERHAPRGIPPEAASNAEREGSGFAALLKAPQQCHTIFRPRVQYEVTPTWFFKVTMI